jgi:uncharacterized membrane protein
MLVDVGDAVMNLVGLILIAALSGGIVAVSLRLRASASSGWMMLEGDRLSEEGHRRTRSAASSKREF